MVKLKLETGQRFLLLVLAMLFAASACTSSNGTTGQFPQDGKTGDELQNKESSKPVLLEESGEVCDPGAPTAESEIPALTDLENNTAVLVNGQTITPAGISVPTRRFPWGVAISPDEKFAYVTTAEGSQYIQVIDLESATVIQTVSDKKCSYSIVIPPDGDKVYIAGGMSGELLIYNRDSESGLLETDPAPQTVKFRDYVSVIAVTPDESKMLVGHGLASLISVVDMNTLEITGEITPGYYPYEILIDSEGVYAYVSNWGGRSVSVIDIASGQETKRIKAGKNPEGMAFANDGAELIVTNSDTDDLTIIDTATHEVTMTLPVDPDMYELKAWSPNSVAVHPTEKYAYVASADHNAIEVIDTEKWEIKGAIPTGKYPVKVLLNNDGSKMFVLNAKGWSSHPGFIGVSIEGSLQIIDTPQSVTELADLTHQVELNIQRPLEFFPESNCEEDMVPLPTREGQKSVIEHVILIIKENKTYDEVLGDLVADSEWHDPELCLFGKATHPEQGELMITPNAHKLSTEFIDFVNYYADAEKSVQGHLWVTQADCNDFLEKIQFDGLTLPGVDPNAIHDSPTIFEHLYNHDTMFRNYGEVVNFFIDPLKEWPGTIDRKYPFWSMGVTDVEKANEIIREWELAEHDSRLLPPFVFIVLPNDHTAGGKAGELTPASMVADNDEGMGMLIDWISHSEYWEKSLVIALQDDPQSAAGDHIDSHRSLLFAASPWVKRGYTSKVHYSIPSVYRTVEIILGLPPMNKNTALAVPMYDMFTDEPDNTPYEMEARQWPVEHNPESGKAAEMSKKYKFKHVDGHEGMGEAIWYLMKGDQPRPPQSKIILD